MTPAIDHPASFRDPSGFVYRRDGVLLRQIEPVYAEDWRALVASGLMTRLQDAGKLVRHEEADLALAARPGAVAVLRPEVIDTISHPFEWAFSQLKDAALLTLDVAEQALGAGMVLKDASAYNVAFHQGRPVFLDTLSFERRVEGSPWVAYRQFCQHFLAPLALMSRVDIRLSQLLRVHVDGVPLDLASALLPTSSWFTPGLLMHVHLHARSQRKHASDAAAPAAPAAPTSFSPQAFLGLLESLRGAITGLDWNPVGTEWADYYQRNNNYGSDGLEHKAAVLGAMLDRVKPATVWDLGGNTGRFSRVASARGARVVTWDVDPACVEAHWREVRRAGETTVLPLLLDLTNPSSGMGWAGEERDGLAGRGPVDCVMALGLVHHLAISNNVPLGRVGRYLAQLGRTVILEFVPKEDSQVVKLLATRKDVFPDYHRAGLEAAFAPYLALEEAVDIPGMTRTLYRFRAL